MHGHPAGRNHISEALRGQYNKPRKRKTFVITDYVQVSQAQLRQNSLSERELVENLPPLFCFPNEQPMKSQQVLVWPKISFGFFHNILHGLPWWLSGKESACNCRRPSFNPWIGKIPWRTAWHPTLAFLPGESHEQRSLVAYSP